MKTYLAAPVIATALIAAPSFAAGCLKGAAAGGVAGHFVGKGHAIAGAAVGCAYGHHRAKVAARGQARPAPRAN